jgi:hypothetical protein
MSGLRFIVHLPSLQVPSKMTTFHFSGQQLDSDLVTSVSSLLDYINVPNLLWGNYLLTVYGVPTVVDVSMLSWYGWSSNTTHTDRVCPSSCQMRLSKYPSPPSLKLAFGPALDLSPAHIRIRASRPINTFISMTRLRYRCTGNLMCSGNFQNSRLLWTTPI